MSLPSKFRWHHHELVAGGAAVVAHIPLSQVKRKYLKEDRLHPQLVDAALRSDKPIDVERYLLKGARPKKKPKTVPQLETAPAATVVATVVAAAPAAIPSSAAAGTASTVVGVRSSAGPVSSTSGSGSSRSAEIAAAPAGTHSTQRAADVTSPTTVLTAADAGTSMEALLQAHNAPVGASSGGGAASAEDEDEEDDDDNDDGEVFV